MFYISEGVPCKILLNHALLPNIKMAANDDNKWLFLDVFKPPIQSDSQFTEENIRTQNRYILSYENFL